MSTKNFKKSGEVVLKNGGYVSDEQGTPLTNSEFILAQTAAHRLVCIAEKMEGKMFKQQKVSNIHALIQQVDDDLSKTRMEEFVELPVVEKGETTLLLEKEALDFVKKQDNLDFAEKINRKMQQFKVIKEFETHGLFFDKGIVKLEKIYTVEEIIKAAKTVYTVLD